VCPSQRRHPYHPHCHWQHRVCPGFPPFYAPKLPPHVPSSLTSAQSSAVSSPLPLLLSSSTSTSAASAWTLKSGLAKTSRSLTTTASAMAPLVPQSQRAHIKPTSLTPRASSPQRNHPSHRAPGGRHKTHCALSRCRSASSTSRQTWSRRPVRLLWLCLVDPERVSRTRMWPYEALRRVSCCTTGLRQFDRKEREFDGSRVVTTC